MEMTSTKDCGCLEFKKEEWDLKTFNWPRKAFYKVPHGQFFHSPIGIGRAINKGMRELKKKGYTFSAPYIMLEEELGIFSGQTLIGIDEFPENDPNVVIWEPTKVYTKYYKGDFRFLGDDVQKLGTFYLENEGKEAEQIYTWTTNCPKCWKIGGGPVVIIVAK